ncbi:RNA binding motif protein 12Ba [Syngnathus scovelli]|uniref:RNA binding motif protein 12Ba n=1 Tax=Syngnathus scovelli TaxID=161590 RepID=UPI00210FA767|nr:RNA binding motif protein 12Ba [Syngnathus scovelli]
MTSIVRLKGLDEKANAEDIRHFFPRLHIPDRGVWIWILGGPQHEAFIAFKSERDARHAVRHSGRSLKGSKVNIRLSSVSELEHKLKYYEKKKHLTSHCLPREKVKVLAQTSSRDPRIASAYYTPISPPQEPNGDVSDKPSDHKIHLDPIPNGCLKTIEKSCDPRIPHIQDRPCGPRTIPIPNGCPQMLEVLPDLLSPIVPSDFQHASDKPHSPQIENCDQPQIFQKGFLLGVRSVLENLQSYPSKQREILGEQDRREDGNIIMSDPQKSRPGYVRLFGLPASTTKADICSFFEGLKVAEVVVNMKLEHRHVCLVKFEDMQDAFDALHFNNQYMGPICVEVRKATEMIWNLALSECENTCHKAEKDSDTAKHKVGLEEEYDYPKKPRLYIPRDKYIVKVCNFPVYTTKTDLQQVFQCDELQNRYNIQHLLDKNGHRTDTAFLFLNQKANYEHVMSCNGKLVSAAPIKVSAITRGEMMELKRSQRWPHKMTSHENGVGKELGC